MKNILRVSLACVIVSYALLQAFKDFFLEQEILGFILVIGGALAGLVFVIGMFVFWFRNKFKNTFYKIAWLIVLLFSYYLIGPIIFYVVVYEMKKTLNE